jgi:catechol 2,3-dioxygenase
MDLPQTDYDTPFNITRTSHVVLTVQDLEASRLFYTEVVGLVVTQQSADTLYLRGIEEACHHSLVLRRADGPTCERIGMRVLRDRDLDGLKTFFESHKCHAFWGDVPHQGRTLHAIDIAGVPLEFCATMPVVQRALTQFHLHRGGRVAHIDHYQILVPDVRKACTFYTHYQAMDLEVAPVRWDPADARMMAPWGLPAQEKWFTEATPFAGVTQSAPQGPAKRMTLERFLGGTSTP